MATDSKPFIVPQGISLVPVGKDEFFLVLDSAGPNFRKQLKELNLAALHGGSPEAIGAVRFGFRPPGGEESYIEARWRRQNRQLGTLDELV